MILMRAAPYLLIKMSLHKHLIYVLICVPLTGLVNIHTGKIDEVMLIKNHADLDAFKKMYGIDGEIEKEY